MHTYQDQTLYIETRNRGNFVIHPGGEIERTDQYFEPSQSWKMLGLVEVKTGSLIKLHQITPQWVEARKVQTDDRRKASDMRLDRYRIRDLDHGTEREWYDPGILNITFYRYPQLTNYYRHRRHELLKQVWTPSWA